MNKIYETWLKDPKRVTTRAGARLIRLAYFPEVGGRYRLFGVVEDTHEVRSWCENGHYIAHRISPDVASKDLIIQPEICEGWVAMTNNPNASRHLVDSYSIYPDEASCRAFYKDHETYKIVKITYENPF